MLGLPRLRGGLSLRGPLRTTRRVRTRADSPRLPGRGAARQAPPAARSRAPPHRRQRAPHPGGGPPPAVRPAGAPDAAGRSLRPTPSRAARAAHPRFVFRRSRSALRGEQSGGSRFSSYRLHHAGRVRPGARSDGTHAVARWSLRRRPSQSRVLRRALYARRRSGFRARARQAQHRKLRAQRRRCLRRQRRRLRQRAQRVRRALGGRRAVGGAGAPFLTTRARHQRGPRCNGLAGRRSCDRSERRPIRSPAT